MDFWKTRYHAAIPKSEWNIISESAAKDMRDLSPLKCQYDLCNWSTKVTDGSSLRKRFPFNKNPMETGSEQNVLLKQFV